MKKQWVFSFILLVMLLLITACGAQETTIATEKNGSPDTEQSIEAHPSSAQAGDVEAGKSKFEMSCIGCHGVNGEGIRGLGSDLTSSPFSAGLSDAELATFIKVGRAPDDPANITGIDMPSKGGNLSLSDADLYDIVAYMRTIEK